MKVNGYEIKPGANLSYAVLLGANLESANLESANLSYADLRFANLQGANLLGANLESAKLDGANVDATILEVKDDKDLKIKELGEELKKYKDTLRGFKVLLDNL